MEVPMLDDDEFQRTVSSKGSGTGELGAREFGPVLEEYRRITGFNETNINAIYHHQISLYGPPCLACGKPLRTRKAKLCVACGKAASEPRP